MVISSSHALPNSHNSRKYFGSVEDRSNFLYEYNLFFFNLYNYVCVCFSVFYWFVSMFLFLLCIDCQIVIVWQFLQILKLYAWEPSYKKKIIENREQELEVHKSIGYLAVFSMLTLTCIPFLVSVCIISYFDFSNLTCRFTSKLPEIKVSSEILYIWI